MQSHVASRSFCLCSVLSGRAGKYVAHTREKKKRNGQQVEKVPNTEWILEKFLVKTEIQKQ